MTDFKQQYKNSRPWFGDVDQRRFLRAYNYDKSRKEVRSRAFNKNRNLQHASPISQPDVSTITDNRMKKLMRWKEERDRKKKLEASKKKPAFKVGVVHHSFYSPIHGSKVALKTPKKTEQLKTNGMQKRITRATEKRLLAKAAAATKKPIKNLPLVSTKQPKTSFAPVDYCFKPPAGLQATPLFGLIPMKQTPQEKYISPQKNIQTSDKMIENFKTFTSPRLSLNKQNSSKKLNKPSICNSNKLNVTTRSSLKEQAKNQIDMQEENSSPSSTDIKTFPLQKITPTCSEKENCAMENLIIFSPYLTRSRGKRNSRKEGQQRLGIGRRSEEIPTKNTVMQNLNICAEEEGRTAQYFKFLVKKETDRLKELCKKWLDIKFEKDVPEDAVYEIQQAVGQTNLLINKKFERFRSLVQDCETGKGQMLVTCRDLQGFWDLTYQEIEDCNMRFERLKNRRNNKWQEEEEYTAKPTVKKRIPVNKQKSKKQIVSSKPNKLQSFILAARKKNKMETDILNKEVLLLQDVDINKKLNKRKSFIVENEKDADTWHSARRSGSIQKMRFSDKSKKTKSPFAAKKTSQKCKTPEVQLDDTISYVNSDQTPGKSILKKSEELENKEARMRSAHKVNFDNTVFLTEVPPDEELQNKLNLAAALSRIDSSDLNVINQSPHFTVGKKLDFKTEKSDSSNDLSELGLETIEKRNKSIQNTSDVHTFINIISSVSIKKSSPNNEKISATKNLRNRHKDIPNEKSDILFSYLARANRDDEMTFTDEIILNDMNDLHLETKVLRNRTVLANNTPKNNRTNKIVTLKRASISKERKISLKSSRKSSLKLLQKDENKYMTPNKSNTMEEENVTLIDNIVKKRSLRKSVAFDETCVACAENKPVLPMTPYSKRRSKTPSRQSRNKHALQDEDLISWNTPDKNCPPRVTRSRSDNF